MTWQQDLVLQATHAMSGYNFVFFSEVMFSWWHFTVALDIIVDCRPIAIGREFVRSNVPVCKPLTPAWLAVKVYQLPLPVTTTVFWSNCVAILETTSHKRERNYVLSRAFIGVCGCWDSKSEPTLQGACSMVGLFRVLESRCIIWDRNRV